MTEAHHIHFAILVFLVTYKSYGNDLSPVELSTKVLVLVTLSGLLSVHCVVRTSIHILLLTEKMNWGMIAYIGARTVLLLLAVVNGEPIWMSTVMIMVDGAIVGMLFSMYDSALDESKAD